MYDEIQRLLADGDWHDSRELQGITALWGDWVAELEHDPHVEMREDGELVLLRSRVPAAAGTTGT